MGFVVVIPARYGATRLPGKPLLDIAGKPLLQHVYERALMSGADEIVIATDDERIFTTARRLGATVCMTSTDHPSGTDRIAEVAKQRGYGAEQVIVNLQGDEPLVPVSLLQQVAHNLASHHQAAIATLCEPIESEDELFNSNVVKVVFDHQGYALYFSRAPLPWERAGGAQWGVENRRCSFSHYRHIGMYAYRCSFLREYTGWAPCALEQAEALEQLRALWHGQRIHVALAVEPAGVGVDTLEDLEKVRRLLGHRH